MHLACVFRPEKIGAVASKQYKTICHSSGVTKTEPNSRKLFSVLPNVAANDAPEKANLYTKIMARYYIAGSKQVKGPQKLLDHGFLDLYKDGASNICVNFS